MLVLLLWVSLWGDRPDAITENVAGIWCGGNPAGLVAWGDSVPLVVDPQGRVFAATTTLGQGRIVALGHGSFVRDQRPESRRFTAQALRWLGRQSKQLRVFGADADVLTVLGEQGVTCTAVEGPLGKLDLAQVDVMIASPEAFEKAGRFDDLRGWVRKGGGLLLVETAWGVLQLNPQLTLETLAAQRLLSETDLRFTEGAHNGYGPDGSYTIDRSRNPLGNATHALECLRKKDDPQRNLAAKVVARVLQLAPLDSSLIRTAQGMRRQGGKQLDERYARLGEQKLKADEEPLAYALLDLDSRLGNERSPAQVKAHPSSVAFPGPVTEQPARHRIALDIRKPGWRSTGLYVPPGKVVRVQLPPEAAAQGMTLQIGAWQDPHDHAHRVRFRKALRRYPVTERVTEIASAIGGPLYVDVPRAATSDEALQLDVRNAVRYPHYRHGVTDPKAWRETIRNYGAPWAEFESENLVLTVPSSAVRSVEDPVRVMQHWDAVHDAMQSLEPRTDNHWADRPYRYVADVSVSWGYMYCPANAPIVIPAHEADEMFDLANFDAEGENELWGHYHEMGHAHQNPLWTDAATGEVTVNIFTVYALHTINGYPLDSEPMRSQVQHAWQTYAGQRASGKPFPEVGGPFPRLQFYALLWHHFGFDAFHAAFDRLRAVPGDQRPNDTDGERNLFCVHFSEVVGHNLSDYCSDWGIAINAATRTRLQALPSWRPSAPE